MALYVKPYGEVSTTARTDSDGTDAQPVDSLGRHTLSGESRPQHQTRRRTFRERASLAWRAVEARAAGPEGQPATAIITVGTEPDTAGAGSRPLVTAVTAPVTAQPTTFTAQVAANTVTGSDQRARNPRRRLPPEQRLSPGRAGGTKTAGSLCQDFWATPC